MDRRKCQPRCRKMFCAFIILVTLGQYTRPFICRSRLLLQRYNFDTTVLIILRCNGYKYLAGCTCWKDSCSIHHIGGISMVNVHMRQEPHVQAALLPTVWTTSAVSSICWWFVIRIGSPAVRSDCICTQSIH